VNPEQILVVNKSSLSMANSWPVSSVASHCSSPDSELHVSHH